MYISSSIQNHRSTENHRREEQRIGEDYRDKKKKKRKAEHDFSKEMVLICWILSYL
jgi:hypothetical protein